jgi:hypothetical protein
MQTEKERDLLLGPGSVLLRPWWMGAEGEKKSKRERLAQVAVVSWMVWGSVEGDEIG